MSKVQTGWWVGLVLASLFLLVPQFASAEVIRSFESDISVATSSVVTVTEQIEYDFEELERHGIFRTIPTRYKTSSGDRTIDIDVIDVTRDSESEPYDISEGYRELEIKIGDPDVTITGLHTYTLTYEVRGALNYLEDFDELYWNVTGDDWDVTIASASTNVSLPSDISTNDLQVACYAGQPGADSRCRDLSQATSTVAASHGELRPGNGLTIAVGFPADLVAEPSAMARASWWLADNYPIFLPLIVLVLMAYLWYTRGRDPRGRGTIMAQYEPPANMTPTMVGTLIDERIHNRDITAGIISLAQQGFIDMTRLEKKKLLVFDTVDYEFTLTRPVGEVSSVTERDILELLFSADSEVGDTVRISDLKGDTAVSKQISRLKKDVTKKMVTDGYFVKNPRTVWGIYAVVAFLSVWAMGMLSGVFGNAVFFVAGIISAVIIAGFGYLMPRKTKEGAVVQENLLGFRLFLSMTQKERLKFHNAPEREPEEFMQYLAYAVAMDVEEQWGEQFDDIYIESPEWYHGTVGGRITAGAFASELSDATAGVTSSVSAAAAAGSSGSGGGGASGGGFGGGGGGSW